ncbi:hypothetical protein QVD99_003937 [Batrachochytrium dendrobatidis]|nr:hypothetical protein QVD99_003937 [Batrachochytrium dendrobatidis]
MIAEVLVCTIIGYVLFMLVIFIRPYPIQHYLIYLNWLNFPSLKFRKGFESLGYRAGSVRNVSIKTSDGLTLGGWHILPRKATANPTPGQAVPDDSDQRADQLLKSAERVYLYFHGNAGNRATFHRNDFYKMMSSLSVDSHVLAIDYRGFGDSSSAVPTEKGLALDSLAAYEWLVARGVAHTKIVLVGHSLGTGVATDLAYYLTNLTKSPSLQLFGGLILVSGYVSICDAAIGYPMLPLLKPFHGYHITECWIKERFVDHWESAQKISAIRTPILVIHGKEDIEINPWQGRALFLEAAGGRLGQKLVDDNGYWQLRESASKFMPHELDGVMITDLGTHEGDLWSVEVTAKSADIAANATTPNVAKPAGPVWLLEVAHGGHNTLSKFLVVSDTIESWTHECLDAELKSHGSSN